MYHAFGKSFATGADSHRASTTWLTPLPVADLVSQGAVDFTLYEFALRDVAFEKLPRQKSVLLYLIFRADASDECFVAQGTIAAHLSMHRQRVAEAVSWLLRANFISTRPRGRVLFYDLSAYRTRQKVTCPPTGRHLSAQRTSTCPPSGHRTSSFNKQVTTAPSARDFEAFPTLEELERRFR